MSSFSVALCHKLLFCTFALVPVLGAKDGDRTQFNPNPLGTFNCPPNMVLTVYNQTDWGVFMICQQPDICGQYLACNSIQGACPTTTPRGLNFLTGIGETVKFAESLTKGCCSYGPYPDTYKSTKCEDVYIMDNAYADAATAGDASAGGGGDAEVDGGSRSVERGRGSGKAEGSGWSRRNGGGHSSADADGQAEVYVHEIDQPVQPLLLVHDISRIACVRSPAARLRSSVAPACSNGYKLIGCQVDCEQTTTTSTTTAATTARGNSPNEKTVTEPSARAAVPAEPQPESTKRRSRKGKTETDPNAPPRAFRHKLRVGQGCFSAESLVRTPTGFKRIDQLEPYETVLVGTDGESQLFEPIEVWYHRLDSVEEDYVCITTELNQTICLSANHLLPVLDCRFARQLSPSQVQSAVEWASAFALRARVGRCVIADSTGDGLVGVVSITSISRGTKLGVYSPITPSGSIVVNGVHASCYTTLENHAAQHALHRFLMSVHSFWRWLTEAIWQHSHAEPAGDIPLPMKLARHIAKVVFSVTA